MHNIPRRRTFAIAAWAIGPLAAILVAHQAMAESRIAAPPNDGPIAVHGMQLHVLPAGHQFHLTGRRPLLPGTDP